MARFVVVESLKGDGAADDIARKDLKTLDIGGIEIDVIIDAKAAPAPGTEDLDAFVGKKVVFLQQSKDPLPKQSFRGVCVDVGNRIPLSVGTPDASGNEAMQMWIPLQVVGEGLDGDDHAGPGLVVLDSSGHELLNGFVSGPGELGEELTAEEEVGAEHFGNGKTPDRMADVFQKLLLEKSREGRGSLGIA